MPMKRLVTLGFLAGLGALAFEPGARADPTPVDARPSAKDTFAQAQAAFARGDFVAAASAFEETARIQPHPAPLLDAAEAWEKAGQPVRAAEDCDRVLAMPSLAPEFAAPARERLARLSAMVATLAISSPVGWLAQIDDAPAERIPFRKRLGPGAHRASLRGAGGAAVATQSLELARGESRDVTFPEPIEPRVPEGPIDAARRTKSLAPPLPSWISFGVSAIAFGGTAVFGVRTLEARAEFDGRPTESSADRFDDNKLVANVLAAVGIVALAVGTFFWVLAAAR